MSKIKSQNRILLFFIAITLLGVACGSPLAQEMPKGTPKEVILNAYNSLKQKKNIVIETIASNDETKTESKFIIQVASPDYKNEIFGSDGKKIFEIVCVGNDIFTFSEGKWEKSKKDSFDNTLEKISEGANSPESIKNAEFVGTENIDGITVYLYQYDFDIDAVMEKLIPNSSKKLPNSDIENKVKVWIDSNGLLKQVENIRKSEGLKGKIVTLRRVEKYKFDEIVKIEAPKI